MLGLSAYVRVAYLAFLNEQPCAQAQGERTKNGLPSKSSYWDTFQAHIVQRSLPPCYPTLWIIAGMARNNLFIGLICLFGAGSIAGPKTSRNRKDNQHTAGSRTCEA